VQLNDPLLFRTQWFIGGRWVDADNGATVDVTNPATDRKIGTVPRVAAAETRRAIEAAYSAFAPWAAKTAKERASILHRWFELMLTHQEDLARRIRGL
jgi:succinate-semialdehyde dehydrogenase/glutarate-semialdehyde dehydrogenase